MVMIGGLGTLVGPIIGGAFFIVLQEKVSSYVQWYSIVIGLVLVFIVLFAPHGLLGFRRGTGAGPRRKRQDEPPGNGRMTAEVDRGGKPVEELRGPRRARRRESVVDRGKPADGPRSCARSGSVSPHQGPRDQGPIVPPRQSGHPRGHVWSSEALVRRQPTRKARRRIADPACGPGSLSSPIS